MDTLKAILDFIFDLPASVLLVCGVVFIAVIVGLRLAFKRPPAHLTAFSRDSGSVLVSRKALQELIRQTCLNDDWVETAKPTVKISGSKVDTRVDLKLSSPENLKETSERLQSRITSLLQKSLNFEQIGQIQIVVSSFSAPEKDVQDAIERLAPNSSDATPKLDQ
ncbi:MAG: hypothetical protein AAGB46_08295 [Verrucomicrobiota bacterium]